MRITCISIRTAAALAALLGVTACDTKYGPNPSGEVTLPEATRRINAREERDAQLRTGTIRDDIPEYTGAPSPQGLWPARVGGTGKTVYRDAEDLVVFSEGPGARNR